MTRRRNLHCVSQRLKAGSFSQLKMRLDRSIIGPGLPGINSAREWNKLARTVNRLWNSRGERGFSITKGAPWVYSAEASQNDVVRTWFDDFTYKVYVWRSDDWDYGSDNPPEAFYVAGAFGKLNNRRARRIAKVVKGYGGASARDGLFCGRSNFDPAGTYAIYLTRNKSDATELVVGTNFSTYYSAVPGNVFPLNRNTAKLRPSFTSLGINYGGALMSGVQCVSDRIIAHSYTDLYSFDNDGNTAVHHTSVANINGSANRSDIAFIAQTNTTVLADAYDSIVQPRGMRILDSDGVTATAPDLQLQPPGGECAFFTPILPNLALWDSGDEYLFAAASLEFPTSANMAWNGTLIGDGLRTCGIVRMELASGTITGLPIGITHYGPDYELSGSDRAQLFCVSPIRDIWFGGGVLELDNGTDNISTDPYRLYRYNYITGEIAYFDGFNARVHDCQYFSTVDGVHQFICVGEFTEYNGVPVEYIVFIDQYGNRLDDLIWP